MQSWERIETVIRYLKLNKASFGREIGLSNNVTISRIIREKRKPSTKVLNMIVKRFPFISYDWLLTGQGEMLEPGKENSVSALLDSRRQFPKSSELKKHTGDQPCLSEQYDRLVSALQMLVETNKQLVESNKKLIQMLANRDEK